MTDEQAKQESETKQVQLLTFTNNKDEHNLGLLQGLLKMVIHTCFTNRLACMEAKNSETGEVELILVGVDHGTDGSLNCYPLFTPIKAEDVSKYLAPDGQGGWLGETKVE